MSLPQSAKQFFDTVIDRINNITQRYRRITGVSGGVLYSAGEGDVSVQFDKPIQVTPSIVTNATELELTKGYAESFQFVFDNWLRTSRSGSTTQNTTGDRYSLIANLDETTTWTYDAVNDRILSTINSITLIGFLSPQPLENYTLEVILRSDDNDDDWIGLCAALAYDQNGRARTLDVLRGLNGRAPLTVDIDRSISTTNIAMVRSPLRWPNGEIATEPLGGNHIDEDHPGWVGFPDGVKLKVTREGDIITVETSDIFDPDNYVEDAKIVIDLNSSPTLRLFKGPCRWGYIAASQRNATWEVLQRPVDRDSVYDMSTNTLSRWINDQWVVDTNVDMSTALKPGRLYFNQVLGNLDYYDPDDLELIRINTVQ